MIDIPGGSEAVSRNARCVHTLNDYQANVDVEISLKTLSREKSNGWNTKKESCELENIVNDIFLEISFFARLIGYFDRRFLPHFSIPFLPFRRYDIYRLVIISQNC